MLNIKQSTILDFKQQIFIDCVVLLDGIIDNPTTPSHTSFGSLSTYIEKNVSHKKGVDLVQWKLKMANQRPGLMFFLSF
jgi:hypothetical protein